MDSYLFAEKIGKLLEAHKAEDIRIINLCGKTEIADYFVISSGRSMTHVRSLVEKIDEELQKDGVSPIRAEGVREGRWAVVDYGDVIVHVFNDETRLLYHLEALWEGK